MGDERWSSSEDIIWYMYIYLLINELSPQTCHSSLSRILRQYWWIVLPSIINVFNNNKWFREAFFIMKQNRDSLVDWVGVKKQRALVGSIFFNFHLFDSLELQCPFHPRWKDTEPSTQQLHFCLLLHGLILVCFLISCNYLSLYAIPYALISLLLLFLFSFFMFKKKMAAPRFFF